MTQKLNRQIPRIESIRIKNYRALRDVTIELTPLTVLLGPNGSGKSTIFDVFAFLSECFTVGLRSAWNRRNRFGELRSRGATGPIEFEIKYRNDKKTLSYYLAIDENTGNPVVVQETLTLIQGKQSLIILNFANGLGRISHGNTSQYEARKFYQSDVLALNFFGQLEEYNPYIYATYQFISKWHLSHLYLDSTRSITEPVSQQLLSVSGDNLPNVIQYLKENEPERLQIILKHLSTKIPHLDSINTEFTSDGRLVLQIKDKLFEKPIMAKYASDGTLKLLAYLTILYASKAPLIGIEEPENHLHPRLLEGLAEECLMASANTQLMITTHSPYFVNGLHPDELWVLYRDDDGYTQAIRASDMERVPHLIEAGAKLGDLWMEGYFEVGDPLTNSGKPKRKKG